MRSLVGRTSHALYDESIAGRRTWFRLHNPDHNAMNPRHQAFSDLASGGVPSACDASRVCNASRSETGAKH